MNNGSNELRVVRFGPFELNLQTGELRKGGVKVRLQEQPFQVLALLLERPGEVVTRDQLRERLWPDDTFVEFEQGLNAAVNRLRTALSDSANDPRWIETVPRRGYRFLGSIEPRQTVSGASVAAAPTRVTSRERFAWLAATIFLAVLAATFLRFEGDEPTARDTTVRRFSFTPESLASRVHPLTRRARISPNGRHIVYAVVRGAGTKLEIRDIDREEPRELDDTDAANQTFWSPDSQFIGFAAGGELRKISVNGGPATRLCALPGGFFAGGAWTPDGSAIVFGGGRGGPHLYQVSDRGGEPTLLSQAARGHSHPYFLPPEAGRSVLFCSVPFIDTQIFVKNLENNESRALTAGIRPSYSESGHIVYEAGEPRGVWALPFSLRTLEATGEAFPLVQNAGEPSLAADGTLVYVDAAPRFRQSQLIWRDRKGTKIAEIAQSQHFRSNPALSPDGQQVAFIGFKDGNVDVWTHDFKRAVNTRITFDKAVDQRPAWSPSGEEIIFDSNGDLFRKSSMGGGDASPLLNTSRDEITADLSPDGKHVIYHVRDAETVRDLWYLSRKPNGSWSEPIRFLETPFQEQTAKFSSDGRYVAYLSNKSGRYEVYVRSFPGGEDDWPISKNGGEQPRWRKDGKELFYVERSSGTLVAVEVTTEPAFSVGSATRLFQDEWFRDRRLSPSYDVSPDGRRIVLGEWLEGPQSLKPPSIHIVQNWYEEFRDREQD